MKFSMSPIELAASAAAHAMTSAITNLETAIKNCGELSSKDAKQSDASKAYFAEQAGASADAIAILSKWRSELASRKSDN